MPHCAHCQRRDMKHTHNIIIKLNIYVGLIIASTKSNIISIFQYHFLLKDRQCIAHLHLHAEIPDKDLNSRLLPQPVMTAVICTNVEVPVVQLCEWYSPGQ